MNRTAVCQISFPQKDPCPHSPRVPSSTCSDVPRCAAGVRSQAGQTARCGCVLRAYKSDSAVGILKMNHRPSLISRDITQGPVIHWLYLALTFTTRFFRRSGSPELFSPSNWMTCTTSPPPSIAFACFPSCVASLQELCVSRHRQRNLCV